MESYGIDFGTTNSGLVGFERGHLRSFGHDRKSPLPSIVAINKLTGKVQAIGRDAWERQDELGEQCSIIRSVKGFLGALNKSWLIGPRSWTPEQVAAEILKALKKKLDEAGGSISAAVCTIPVGFSARKRAALRRAANAAGIEVKAFVPEPTAAVCRHFALLRKWPKVVVFDWGGGTLDISVVVIEGHTVTELATKGLSLGGDDIDHKLAQYVHTRICSERGLDKPYEAVDLRSRDRLREMVEAAKRRLSREGQADVTLISYSGLLNVSYTLTAQVFQELLQPEYEQVYGALSEAVQRKALTSFEEIGCVLMVGGSSKLRGLVEYFTFKGIQRIEPPPADAEWNIAQGAAILSATSGQYRMARDLGLSLSDGSYFPLLCTGDVVTHAVREHHFGLVEDTSEARFAFVTPTHTSSGGNGVGYETLGSLSVRAYGFSDEPIMLRSRVSKDLVVEVEGWSTHSDQSQSSKWEYEGLNFRYELPPTL